MDALRPVPSPDAHGHLMLPTLARASLPKYASYDVSHDNFEFHVDTIQEEKVCGSCQGKMVKSQCTKLREVVAAIVDAHANESPSADLAGLSQVGKLLLMEMKDSNRQQSESLEGLREETASAKKDLDSLNLVLQNLLYEKSYYEKEIKTCEGFQSAHADEEVSLLDLQDYRAATGDADADEGHETMLKRLAHEIKRRKEFSEQLGSVKKQRSKAEAEESRQQAILKGFATKLKSVEQASTSVRSQLQDQKGAMAFLSRRAELLPTPLYILYTQLAACIDAHGMASAVTIDGSAEDAENAAAEAVRKRLETESQNAVIDRGDEADRDMMDVDRHKKGKHKGDAAAGPESTSEDIYKSHPLSVVLELYQSASNKSPVITVRFSYLPILNLVTAQAQDPADNIYLANLLPEDTGAVTPNEANNQFENGTFKFDMARPDRPYRWAQHLSGLDFLATVPATVSGAVDAVEAGVTEYRSQARHLTVLTLLRERKESLAALKAQLDSLSKGTLPPLQGLAKRVFQCRINTWKESGPGAGGLMLLSAAYSRLLGATVSASSRPGGNPPSVENITTAERALRDRWHELGQRRFRCMLRKADVELETQVEISLEYPLRPAVFKLQWMRWPTEEGTKIKSAAVCLPKCELLALEAQVNLEGFKHFDGGRQPCDLLVAQLSSLMVAFDVYAEQAHSQRAIIAADAQPRPAMARGREMRRTAAPF